MLQQTGINHQNALDPRSGNDKTGEPETAEDSDSKSEQESSDSDTEDETKPKSFLDGILTAVRSWSTGGRWKNILNETSEEKVHKVVQDKRDPKDTVVREPPPVIGCLDMANPYPGPAESPDYIDIGPGYQHKDLYEYMKKVVAELHLNFSRSNQ